MNDEKKTWKVSPEWYGKGEYHIGTCPRCECDELEYDHDAGYYNYGLYILPGKCPECGQTFTENYDAECWDNGWEDEEAVLVVHSYDVEDEPSSNDVSVGGAGNVKADIAEMMTQVGENCLELDGSDDFGYVEEWDSGRIKVAWYNYCEMLDDISGILYPGDSLGLGRYAVESTGCEGGMEPERLADVKYVILPDDGTDVGMICADAVKGLADTLEHAEAVIKWAAEHGKKMRYVEIR